MNFMQTMLAIQKATTDAKARTGDQTLGTRVGKGKLQVVRVVKHAKGLGCDVFPVTDYLPIPEAIRAIEAL
jgi:hypothetical protein